MSHPRWTVLSVSYPFAAVGPTSVGGAETVLAMIDRALVDAGHDSIVVAAVGSRVRGRLVQIPATEGTIDTQARIAVHAAVRAAIRETLLRERVDVVHMHGVDFHAYVPTCTVPVVVTLHLPLEQYPAELLPELSDAVHLHCVSSSQHRRMPEGVRLLDPIANGIDLDEFRPTTEKASYAIALGRICSEKGQHLALDAAALARVPLLLAGRVFSYAQHVAYFHDCIEPRLDASRRFLGPVAGAWRRELLARARCLVVSSVVEETSSLVAMEAFASGTPVVALRRGALADLVEHGVTGFLADDVEGLAEGIRRASEIDPSHCRAVAAGRHDGRRMLADYFAAYARLTTRVDPPRPAHDVLDRHCVLSG